jgi:hypothetical protein
MLYADNGNLCHLDLYQIGSSLSRFPKKQVNNGGWPWENLTAGTKFLMLVEKVDIELSRGELL